MGVPSRCISRLGGLYDGWRIGAIVGTYLALTGPNAKTVYVCGWFVFASALATGIFQAWRTEYQRRLELEALPQLRLTFVPGQPPYEQDHVGTKRDRLHYFRVGVSHDGLKQVGDVRVILAEFDPAPMGFPLFHCLSLMDAPPGTSSFALACGSEPTRFVDVLFQERHRFTATYPPDPMPKPVITGREDLTVCLATEHIRVPARRSKLRLVAEGRDAKSAEIRLEVTDPDGLVVFELRPSPDEPAVISLDSRE